MGLGHAPRLSVFLPFKYDLGGAVTDTEQLITVLRRLHGEPTVDAALLRSWNLSYLAGHAPVLWCPLPGGAVVLGGVAWDYSRRLRVYPWLGVVSVDYTLTTAEPQDEQALALSGFYDDLVAWKNQDYLPYLHASGALSPSLRLQIPGSSDPATGSDLHGSLIRDLQRATAKLIEPRPFRYAFHDFRMCFTAQAQTLDDETVHQLLWLSAASSGGAPEEAVEFRTFSGLSIASSGWSTIIRTDAETAAGQIDLVLTLLNLIHAQWFICQLWINAHNLRGPARSSQWQLADAHVLTANQLALAHDLSEVENLSVMLKDPGLLRVATFLEARMEVQKHRATAMSRLRALENHSRQLADFKSESELRRFQALFAISAAAGVASLVPALAQVGFSYIHTITTIAPLLGLWGLFAIDLAVTRRWFTSRRKRRRDREAERFVVEVGPPVGAPEEQHG